MSDSRQTKGGGSESRKAEGRKVDERKSEVVSDDAKPVASTNYVSKKTDSRSENYKTEGNDTRDNRRYDNRRYDNRRYDNRNDTRDTRRYDNSSYDNRYDNREPRRYDNANTTANNSANTTSSDTNTLDNRSDTHTDSRRYDNRRYDNREPRRYDNRRYDNRRNNYDSPNTHNEEFTDRYIRNDRNDRSDRSDRSDRNDRNDRNASSDKVEVAPEPVKTQSQPPVDPAVLTQEQIAKREEYMVPIESFDDLGKYLDLKIVRGVMAYGFDAPSPIQQKAIKPFLSKCDLIAQAQSGTGKTATFCIGTLGTIDFTKNEIQAIVIAHTMELAQQIEHVFSNIGKYIDVRLSLAIKSIPVRENIDTLLGRNADGVLPHVVIGTPGRVLDMIKKKIINVDTIKVLVLDEADELLSEGFMMQIKEVISAMNAETQITLFSATMDTNFFKMTEKFVRNPINILINKENLTLEGIKQYNINCEKNEFKFDTLCDLYSLFSTSQTIIYCNYHQSVELLTKKMQEQNFKVSLIHGSMDIAEREDAMRKFRNLTTRVLISTDLLGRGIDVQQVSIVINYDIPFKNESYIHRIGRSGRHGRTGVAINFVTNNDVKRMDDIAKYYSTKILDLPADLSSVFQNVN